jgi:hypothetical protein
LIIEAETPLGNAPVLGQTADTILIFLVYVGAERIDMLLYLIKLCVDLLVDVQNVLVIKNLREIFLTSFRNELSKMLKKL